MVPSVADQSRFTVSAPPIEPVATAEYALVPPTPTVEAAGEMATLLIAGGLAEVVGTRSIASNTALGLSQVWPVT